MSLTWRYQYDHKRTEGRQTDWAQIWRAWTEPNTNLPAPREEEMRPVIKIDVSGLIGYKNELEDIIHRFEQLNVEFDERGKELEAAGFDLKDVEKMLSILFKE